MKLEEWVRLSRLAQRLRIEATMENMEEVETTIAKINSFLGHVKRGEGSEASMETHKEKLRTAVYTAKLAAFTTGSFDPDTRKRIERLREVMDEAQGLCDEIIGEGG